ncbi:hypothetical protein AKJ09_07739 [Labilithrix luteola]|uniref:BNR repeat domain protein n=1 Tax=Labilithrix luteola TaxID=1391654 RepID=A0A0K1Q5G9_9BACT|nr:hypothetical protein AKJ09_07739 [Labilithrix luteola]
MLVACSDDPAKPSFEDRPDATASLPDAAAPVEDAGIDVHPPEVPTEEPIVCAAKPCVTQLVAGRSHFCALLDDKTVRCWGCGEKALGVYDGGNVSGSYQARPMSMGLSSVEQISAANETTCARLTNGTLSCWGGSQLNELGLDPPRADVAAHGPGLIALDGGAVDGFTRVDVATSGTVFALRASGELWSWGKNVNYMLGRSNEDKTYLSPGPAEDLADMKIVRARGGSFPDRGGIGLAITEKGQLLAWGNSLQMVRYPGPVPFLVENFENVTSVAATTEHVCVVASGRLYCWGRNGLLACTGTTDAALTPVEIETRGTAPVQQVDVHAANTCVKLTDGTIECCGSDDKGQLATGEADGGAGPARLLTRASAFTEHAVQIAVSVQTICALVQGGTVQCWGGNERGELGQGTADTERHPKPVTVTFD